MHGLHGRVRQQSPCLSVRILGTDNHDRQLKFKRHPLLRIARQPPKLPHRLLQIRLAGDLEVPSPIVRARARFQHPRKAELARRHPHTRQHALALLDRHLLRHGTPLLAQVVLLRELVLDQPQRAPRRVHSDGLLAAIAAYHAVCGDLLEHVGLDVLDLDGQDVAAGGEGADLGRVFEGACYVRGVAVDLLGGAVGLVQDGDGNVEGRGGFAEHAT